MKVAQRLYLAVMPAILGVFTVLGLAYWGRYTQQAPELLVVVAVIASVASLIIAWRNTRYVARRVQRLAHARGSPGGAAASGGLQPHTLESRLEDELDEIEANVEGLSSEVAAEREAGTRRSQAAEDRANEYGVLLNDAITTMVASLKEAQLPLHILLSSPFGELNENQEEMLGSAQQALESADAEVRRMRKLVEIDREAISMLPQRISVAELLNPSLAIADARASAAVVRLRTEIADTLPRVIVDPVHTQEAITLVLTDAVTRTKQGGEVIVRAEEEGKNVVITVTPGVAADSVPLAVRLACRVVGAQKGNLDLGREKTTISLPCEAG
ncbi:MAG: HAMP domain-containing histidine kinase [Anaerolineae bacterium]|nr:HAMP domain-containing histidine kinase [Gemmatimonadaceae bacterium]